MNIKGTKIGAISSVQEFECEALELFRFQARECAPYRNYLALIGCDVESVQSVEQIPCMPIELFKSCDVYCAESPAEVVFTSSSTTGQGVSRHPMASLQIYEEAFTLGFEKFYGAVNQWGIYALLPSYMEREGSSLIYMVEKLIEKAGSGGMYLRDHEALLRDMAADPKPKILLGVTYALLDLAESGAKLPDNVIVMETGGMKGQRAEISKDQLHEQLCAAFGVDVIHSEYGMAELTSQAYSEGNNLFACPPWMQVLIRDINNPQRYMESGARGAINIIDLASRYSCAFIQTQDMGRIVNGNKFTIEGRLSGSEIRGCNLLVQ